jgi:hypothetical protein
MKRRVVLLVATIAITASFRAGSAPAVPEEGKVLLMGTDTSKMRVLFRKLDDGAVLWTSPTTLGAKLSVEAGHHNLSVMCEFKSSE